MSDEGKLINVKIDFSGLQGLSDSARIFAERISKEIGDFTQPYHSKRKARGKVDVALIQEEGKLVISEVQQRALQRLVIEEGKKQENIESIATQAISHIAHLSKPNEIEEDWLSNFFEKCRLTSDTELQNLWARLLADESNSPNSVSKKTVNLLSEIEKKDAIAFTNFCSFVWMMGALGVVVLDIEAPVFKQRNISFMTLKHFDALGFISFESTAGYRKTSLPKKFAISYYGRWLQLEGPNEENEFKVGHVMLTEFGGQLAKVCGSKPDEEAYMHFVEGLFSQGYVMNSFIGHKAF